MAERYKTFFYSTIIVTILWFVFIFLSLPQIDREVIPESIGEGNGPAKELLVWTSPIGNSNNNKDGFLVNNQATDQESNHKLMDHDKTREYFRNQKIDIHKLKPPNSFNYMKYFHLHGSGQRQINKIDTLFYEFNPVLVNNSIQNQNVIGQEEHSLATKKLASINNHLDKYVEIEGFKLFAFNLLVSNRIGLTRPLPDTRHAKCIQKNQYDSKVHSSEGEISYSPPDKKLNVINLKASIVICYYNEAPSALLRTIYSVLMRSPRRLLHEIIVVDDFSETEYNLEIIKPFVSGHPDLIKIVRTNKREGLIRARLYGAGLAKGDVLIFLDSHVEANVGWLEPLIQTIQDNRATIACPMIDLINYETLIYTSSPMVKGGLNSALNFKWDSVESDKLKTYDDFTKPIESPTLAGGLYAIERDYFYQLGAYDSKMNLWGGENIELSLRAWMCGGQIVILPCSRLGHIFRKKRPYGPDVGEPDSLLFNSHRIARVWLNEEYLEKFYKQNPQARDMDSGDINERIELKAKLECKNFDWYLDNVYPKLKQEGKEEIKKTVQIDLSRSKNLFERRKHKAAEVNSRYERRATYISPNKLNKNSSDMTRRKSRDLKQNNHNLNNRLKVIDRFQIRSAGSNLCIEAKDDYLSKSFTRLVLNECVEDLSSWSPSEEKLIFGIPSDDNPKSLPIRLTKLRKQLFSQTDLHDYRLGNQCLDLIKNLPLIRKCHSMGSFQSWLYDSNQRNSTNLYNSASGLCLAVEKVQIGEPIIITICDKRIVNNSDSDFYKTKLGISATKAFKVSDHHHSFDWNGRPFMVSKSLNKNTRQLCQKWNLVTIKNSTLDSPVSI